MSALSVYERLRRSRIARGEDLASVARRAGVREALLQAIEAGRFEDLPRGIYGRSAIRSFATALGLDATEVLAECDPLLPAPDDPIDALARLRGVRAAPKRVAPADPEPVPAILWSDSAAMWKPLAAAAIDGGIITVMLLFLVAATMTFCAAPLSAFRTSSAPAFGLMGVLLAGYYFVCFAGIGGATFGERVIRLSPACEDRTSHDLRSVLARTLRVALRDALSIHSLGDSLRRAISEWHTRMQSPTTTVWTALTRKS
jgi:transcriptional regulator with XRE-family HTH domain